MEINIKIKPIGYVLSENGKYAIKLNPPYHMALTNIDGFSHLQVFWWGNLYDDEKYRSQLVTEKPYKNAPDTLGIFATRSPVRPNPILLTNIFVQHIDFEKGIIKIPYIDAEHNTPILDIKPYHLSERIKNCEVPEWCQHWPAWEAAAASFNWAAEFNF